MRRTFMARLCIWIDLVMRSPKSDVASETDFVLKLGPLEAERQLRTKGEDRIPGKRNHFLNRILVRGFRDAVFTVL